MKLKQKFIELFNLGGKASHSFQGEDIMLWRYFQKRKIRNGFFIDVGAYHPKYFNNTWRLRKKLGFRGINIEPTNNINLFKLYRRNDINIACVIGDEAKWTYLNVVKGNLQLSGLDKSKMAERANGILPTDQYTLTDIVKTYKVKTIDLLDVDVEGSEMGVLRGYDWSIRPRLILIEDDKDKEGEIQEFLTVKYYKQIAHTLNNALYEDGTL